MDKEKLKIEFEQPKHGWLPVQFGCGTFKLTFKASNIPINPMDQLISSLRQVIKGMRTEIGWHMEPKRILF